MILSQHHQFVVAVVVVAGVVAVDVEIDYCEIDICLD